MAYLIVLDELGPGRVLRQDLKEVIQAIPADLSKLTWAVLAIEAVGDITPIGMTMKEFMRKVSESPRGVRFSLGDLAILSNLIHQTYEIVLVGCKDPSDIPVMGPKVDMSASCEVVIELIDCAFWEITARKKSIIDHLRFKLSPRGPEAKIVGPEVVGSK